MHNDIIILNKTARNKNPRIYLPTLTPVDDNEEEDDEPLRPLLSPFAELINDDWKEKQSIKF
jgi:hypothetical protein